MRNLKRVLSLALASAMLLGMMVMGAGAADTKKPLTDLDKVTNKEAVNLMVDLGIITGKPDGSYGPTETVDRGTMATLIYRVLEASSDASAFVGASSTLVDVKGNWAEGYINYCSSLNIVNGDGTKFYPANKVTVVQAAKMLLVSLGYDAELSKYQNDANWSINIMKDAQKAGLLTNIAQKASDEMTRDNAAQMIFNAMMAKTVEPETERDQGVLYLKKYAPNATTLGNETYKLFKVTATVTGVNADGTVQLTSIDPSTMGSVLNGAKFAANADMIGNKITAYYKADYNTANGTVTPVTTGQTMYSSAPTVSNGSVVATSKDGTTIAALTTATDKKYVAALDSVVSYFVNGKAETRANVDSANVKGAIVDLIDNDQNGKIDVVKLTVKSVATLTGDADTKTVTNGDTQVKVPGVIGAFSTANTVKNVVGYEGLKKGDVVMFVKVGTVTTIEKVEPVSGQMTAKTSDSPAKIVFGGTTYSVSGLISGQALADVTGFATYNKDSVLYLDNNGTVIAITLAPGEKTETNYAVVIDYAYVKGSGVAGSSYGEAKVLKTDGTAEVVKVSKINFDGSTLANALVPVVDEPDASGNVASKAGFIGNADNGKFFTYNIDSDGNYELTLAIDNVTDKVDIRDGNTGTITPNQAAFATGFAGNANTIFLMSTTASGKTTYSVATGVANAPRFVTANQATFNAVVVNGLTTVVFISNGDKTVGGASEKTVYFLDSTKYTEYPAVTGGLAAHRGYKAIVDGKVGEVKVASASYSSVATGLKAVTYTGELVTGIAAPTATSGTGTVAAANTVVGLGASYYTYLDDAVVYTINTDGTVDIAGIESIATDANDPVTIVMEGATGTAAATVKEVYVVKTDFDTGLTTLTIDQSLTLAPVFAKATTSYAASGTISALAGKTVALTPTLADGTNCVVDAGSVVSVVIPANVTAGTTYTLTVIVAVKDSVADTNPVSTTYTVTLTVLANPVP